MYSVLPLQDNTAIDVTGCGNSKGCLRIPSGCVGSACTNILTWTPGSTTIDFELSRSGQGWAGVGFSKDTTMVSRLVSDTMYIFFILVHIPPETAFVLSTQCEQKIDKQHEIDMPNVNVSPMQVLANTTIFHTCWYGCLDQHDSPTQVGIYSGGI